MMSARELELKDRIERLEREVARVVARLDGASVTLVPGSERLRAPASPDLSVELQRAVIARFQRERDAG